MSLHLAASGAKQDQWVQCNAKTPASCPNVKKNPTSPHISRTQLYGMKEWVEEQDNKTVFIKDLGGDHWDAYSEIPASEQKIYEQIAKDKQKEAKEKRDAANKAATQRRQEEARIAREIPGILANHRKNQQRQTTPQAPSLPATKRLHYSDVNGIPQSLDVKTYAYPAEDKRILEKFYDRTKTAFLYSTIEKRQEEMIHYYVTHKDTIHKYHSPEFVQSSLRVLNKNPLYGSSTPQYDAWKNFEQDLKLDVVPGSHYTLHKIRQEAQDVNKKGKKKVIPSTIHTLQEQVAQRVTNEGIALPDVKLSENMRTEEKFDTPANKIGEAIGSFLYRFRRKEKE